MAFKDTVKEWFKTGLKPTQAQFYNKFDFLRWKDEKIPIADIDQIESILNAKADSAVVTNHISGNDAHQALFELKQSLSEKGEANGYAPLNEIIKISPQFLDIVDDLITGGSNALLSAEQGKVLQERIDDIPLDSTSVGAITPDKTIPPTINVHGFAAQAGTYANCGGVVVPANSLAFISRVVGVWSISSTVFDLSEYSKKVDVKNNVLNTNTIDPVTGKAVAEFAESKASESISKKYYIDFDENEFIICDGAGNIIFKTDDLGIKSTKAEFSSLKTGSIDVTESLTLDKLRSKFLIGDDDNLEICDSYGNLIFKASPEGVFFIGETTINHRLKDKTFISIGDSLDNAPHLFSTEFARLTGSIYQNSYSQGGTNSIPNGADSMQDRVKKFLLSAPTCDFVIFENVNDDWQAISSNLGTFATKKPFMISNYSVFSNGFVTQQSALDYWEDNFNDVVSGVTDKIKGTCLRLAYSTNSTILTVTGSATQNGTVVISVGETVYSTPVLLGDSASIIASKIYITNYEGYSKSIAGNVITFKENQPNPGTLVVTSNNSGSTINMTNASATSYVNKYFMGTVLAEFTVKSNWDDYLSLYSSYKGMIEAVSAAGKEILWLIPSKYNLVWTTSNPAYKPSLVNGDGTFNINAINSNLDMIKYKALVAIQMEVCKQYALKYSNAQDESGINPFNVATYYGENNVHPKSITYTVWADIMKKDFN